MFPDITKMWGIPGGGKTWKLRDFITADLKDLRHNHYETCWTDYDTRMTYCQVASVFRSSGRGEQSYRSRDKYASSSRNNNSRSSILTKCVSSTTYSDSGKGFCFLASGEYHIPYVDL